MLQHPLPHENLSDARLVELSASDHDAFSELVGRHSRSLRTHALSLTSDVHLADDLIGRTIEKLWTAIAAGQQIAYPGGWLRVALRNTYVDHYRRTSRVVVTDCTETLDRTFTDPDVASTMSSQLILQALGDLPDDVRDLIVRTEIAEEPIKTVAGRYRCSPNAMTKRRRRALRALQAQYLHAHIRSERLPHGCQVAIGTAIGHITQPKGDSPVFVAHAQECAVCTGLMLELNEIRCDLRALALPAILAAAGGGSISLALPGGSHSAVAIAELAHSVSSASASGTSAVAGTSLASISAATCSIATVAAVSMTAATIAVIPAGMNSPRHTFALVDRVVEVSDDVAPDDAVERYEGRLLDPAGPNGVLDVRRADGSLQVAPTITDQTKKSDVLPFAAETPVGDPEPAPAEPVDPDVTDDLGVTDPEPTDPGVTDPDPDITDPEPEPGDDDESTDPDPDPDPETWASWCFGPVSGTNYCAELGFTATQKDAWVRLIVAILVEIERAELGSAAN